MMRKTTRFIYCLVAAGVLLPAAASAALTASERRAVAQAKAQELSVENVPPVEVAENVRGERAEYEFAGRFRPRDFTGPPGSVPVMDKYLRLTYGAPGSGVVETFLSESFGPPPTVLPVPSFRGKTRIGAGAVGAVKLGDSEQQVISAWGNSCTERTSCSYFRAAMVGGIPTEGLVHVEFHNGKAKDIRIEAVFPGGQISVAPALAKLETARHIGLGSTQAQLLQAYHHMRYAGNDVWVYAERAHHDLVFEIVNNVVGRIEVRRA